MNDLTNKFRIVSAITLLIAAIFNYFFLLPLYVPGAKMGGIPIMQFIILSIPTLGFLVSFIINKNSDSLIKKIYSLFYLLNALIILFIIIAVLLWDIH